LAVAVVALVEVLLQAQAEEEALVVLVAIPRL
jgi:hypothetical protein